jgi:hypothetical protein
MTAERSTAAALNRRHRLQLCETDMPRVLNTPRGPVVAEDICHLQGRLSHDRRSDRCSDIQIFQWAFHLTQEVGGDPAVACGVLKFRVSEQHLDDADVFVMR